MSAINIFSNLFDKPSSEIESILADSELSESIDNITNNRQLYREVFDELIQKQRDLLSENFSYPKEFTQEHFKFISNKPIQNIEFDYCCHPKVGDQIVAFYQNGSVIIHHKLCQEAYKKMKAQEPMVYVSWTDQKVSRYQLIISLQNRKGVLAELLHKLALLDLNVLSIELGIKSSESAEFCKIEVESKEQKSRRLKEKLSKKFKLIDIISLNDAYK